MRKTNPAAVFFVASMIIGALASSCSDAPPIATDTTSTGTSTSTSSGGGSGGSGGSGGGPMADVGHPGMETVNGGQYMKSSKYSMIYTIGQPSPNQSKVSSDKYRMTGGIVGATGSLP